jgi:hypothetical protein
MKVLTLEKPVLERAAELFFQCLSVLMGTEKIMSGIKLG